MSSNSRSWVGSRVMAHLVVKNITSLPVGLFRSDAVIYIPLPGTSAPPVRWTTFEKRASLRLTYGPRFAFQIIGITNVAT